MYRYNKCFSFLRTNYAFITVISTPYINYKFIENPSLILVRLYFYETLNAFYKARAV